MNATTKALYAKLTTATNPRAAMQQEYIDWVEQHTGHVERVQRGAEWLDAQLTMAVAELVSLLSLPLTKDNAIQQIWWLMRIEVYTGILRDLASTGLSTFCELMSEGEPRDP